MLAGIKTAAVINVGTATMAAFIGAGGFGERIVAGLAVNDTATMLAGALPAAALALLVQAAFDLAERRWCAAARARAEARRPPGAARRAAPLRQSRDVLRMAGRRRCSRPRRSSPCGSRCAAARRCGRCATISMPRSAATCSSSSATCATRSRAARTGDAPGAVASARARSSSTLLAQQGDVARTQNEQIDSFRTPARGDAAEPRRHAAPDDRRAGAAGDRRARGAGRLARAQRRAAGERAAALLGNARTSSCARSRRRTTSAWARCARRSSTKLAAIQADNEKKLEQIRGTVDEKLHATLEQRLGESFKQVAERLEQVHRGLGEMQTLARDVGSLSRVLNNVKTRGTLGEVQLGALLEQVFAPEQYARNVETMPGSNAARRLRDPAAGPARATASRCGCRSTASFRARTTSACSRRTSAPTAPASRLRRKAIEMRLRIEARTIRAKYVAPPHTTDFGILFVPTEGLYAEALRRPGPVRGAAARAPHHAGRADDVARHADQPADGLSHARARAAQRPRCARCSARSRPSSASSATSSRRRRRSSTRRAKTIDDGRGAHARDGAQPARRRGAAGGARPGAAAGRRGGRRPRAGRRWCCRPKTSRSRMLERLSGRARTLLALIVGQICLHSCMAGVRMASPLLALQRRPRRVGGRRADGPVRRRADRCWRWPPGGSPTGTAITGRCASPSALTVAGGLLAVVSTLLDGGQFVVLCVAATLAGAGANVGLIAIQRTAGRARAATPPS